MEELSEFKEIIAKREGMYTFLAHLYKTEVDEKVLAYLRAYDFPREGEPEMLAGYQLMQNYIAAPNEDPITDLAVDYAKVFLGAGLVDINLAAYPYESVYTSENKEVMQDARDEMLARLRAHRLEIKHVYNELEDHLFIQLEFMAFMCRQVLTAIEKGDLTAALDCLSEQQAFVENHLLNWVPRFCQDVERHALTDFYRGLAKVTSQYLLIDKTIIEELLPLRAA